MFTAREFLESYLGIDDLERLREEIARDPDRLRTEFLSVGLDSNESAHVRTIALLILCSRRGALKCTGVTEIGHVLIKKFKSEVSWGKVLEIKAAIEENGCHREAMWVYQFAIAVGIFGGVEGSQIKDAVTSELRVSD